MLKFARLHRSLAALPLLAALASAAPLVRWCPIQLSQVTVESFVTCDSGARECGSPEEQSRPGADAHAGPCAVAQPPACPGESAPPCAADHASARTHACDLPACAKGCPLQPNAGSGRAFCLEAPFAAMPGRGAPALDPPPALPAELVAGLLPAPAGVIARTRLADAARPHSPPRSLPPPVRGPPFVA
jgi:hypothetical protein